MGRGCKSAQAQIDLPPGFRFNPTDEELVVHYLCKKAASQPFAAPVIAEIDLYKFDPWDLPDKALFGEKEWYFFSSRERKYPNGSRPNRAAGSGYWKATGTDKPISSSGGGGRKVGVKKALVFYKGKPPKGVKTNWIMHEYRLPSSGSSAAPTKTNRSLRMDDWVLCRIYEKTYGAQKATCKEGSPYPDDMIESLTDMDDSKFLINLPRINSLNRLNSLKFVTEEFKPENMQIDQDNVSSFYAAGKKFPAPAGTMNMYTQEGYSSGATDTNTGAVTEAASSGYQPREKQKNLHLRSQMPSLLPAGSGERGQGGSLNANKQTNNGRFPPEVEVQSSRAGAVFNGCQQLGFGFDNVQSPLPQLDRLTSLSNTAFFASLAAELL